MKDHKHWNFATNNPPQKITKVINTESTGDLNDSVVDYHGSLYCSTKVLYCSTKVPLNKGHSLLNTREVSEILPTAEKDEQMQLCTLTMQKKGGLGIQHPLL